MVGAGRAALTPAHRFAEDRDLPSVSRIHLALASAVTALAFAGSATPATAQTLVGLGDSYSSGEGAGDYDAETDDRDVDPGTGKRVTRSHRCHRTKHAWPRLLGIAKEHHLACSGARREHLGTGQVRVLGERRGKRGSQRGPVSATAPNPDGTGQLQRLEAIAGENQVDRVVMTMSGNDIRFADRIRDCYGAALTVGDVGCLNNLGDIRRDLRDLGPQLVEDYRKIMEAARAPLLVVGYPRILPPPGAKTVDGCWAGKTTRKRATALIADLDATFADAAREAGADFLSVATALKEHELCTSDSWMHRLHPGSASGYQEQGHPLLMGQLAIANRVRKWLNAQGRACTPSADVSAIVDDSGSMLDNDPEGIRRRALELLLSKPAAQSRTFGAVEFATEAGPLFAPGPVSAHRPGMLAALGALGNDGFDDGGDGTDYNQAFRAGAANQPSATARIFLTDGAHNEDVYEDVHAGGPPTHVIGLNIGPAGAGDDDADRLARIASETRGTYFPLRLLPDDSPQTQVGRLQGVVNQIDAQLTCATGAATTPTTLTAANRPSPAIRGLLDRRQRAVEIVISWGTEAADVDLASASVRNRAGRIIGDLEGTKRIRRGNRRKRARLSPSVVEGRTFDIVTLPVPAGSRTLGVTVKAPTLAAATDVTVQIRPAAASAPPGQTQVGTPGAPAPTPAPSPSPSPTATPEPTPTPAPTPPPRARVDAYGNYGPATAGHAMCRGNPDRPESMPGGTVTQTFTIRRGVASLDDALVQIDPDSRVTGHASLLVNGEVRATAAAAAAGDTRFSFPSVRVRRGDEAALSIRFSATFGKITTVYGAAAVGGTLTVSNSCPDGAPSTTSANGLRAVVSGWNR